VKRAVAFIAVMAPAAAFAQTAPPKFTPEENTIEEVEVHGVGWASPRGIGDVRVRRDQLDAAPRAQTPEMLSAAPGFFVDHEDGEGLGNDVFVRGFDLEHGAGVEMRLGSFPINVPHHILGAGYADASFIIPEVVRGVRVLSGTFDPRQGDAAIVGSAYFDLGVVDRGFQTKTTYGSFDQVRVLGIAAPKGVDEETFGALALRRTNGFGQNRAAESASLMAQYGLDLGASDHLRIVATGWGVRSALAGVVRQDDVSAGRIGLDDTYSRFGENQSVQAVRVLLGADLDHVTRGGSRLEFEPWLAWTDLRARQNFTGNIQRTGLGDLLEQTNAETAAGFTSRYHAAAARLARAVELVVEPGLTFRAAHGNESRSMLDPSDLAPWERRFAATVDSLDVGAYADLDFRFFKKMRLSGGVRADLLAAWVSDGLVASASRDAADAFVGPRVTAAYDATRELSVAVSYGEGFRSRAAEEIERGATPYSRTRSVEAGVRFQDATKRFATSLAIFDTFTESELVFDATSGGLEGEGPSTRRGFVGSISAKPWPWLYAQAAVTFANAQFTSGDEHFVPNVPPVMVRLDASARRTLARASGKPVVGRMNVGYTYLAGRHLTDEIVGPETHALNAGLAVRWDDVELGLEGYNLLGVRYPDDAAAYASSWGRKTPSVATHISAAPPTSLLGTVALFF
jgi:iron complex outermembrane receptor protein